MAKGHNATGRSTTIGRVAVLPHTVLFSPAYSSLPALARALLVELAAIYTGGNNGRIGLSVRQAVDRLQCGKDTASRAFHALQERGLIEATFTGTFRSKSSPLASEWRLTWKRCDRSGALPSFAFQNWKAGPRNPEHGSATGTVRFGHRDSRPASTASRFDSRDSKGLSPRLTVRPQGHS